MASKMPTHLYLQSYLPHLQSYLPHLHSYLSHLQSYLLHLQSYLPHLQSYLPHLHSYLSHLQPYLPCLQSYPPTHLAVLPSPTYGPKHLHLCHYPHLQVYPPTYGPAQLQPPLMVLLNSTYGTTPAHSLTPHLRHYLFPHSHSQCHVPQSYCISRTSGNCRSFPRIIGCKISIFSDS